MNAWHQAVAAEMEDRLSTKGMNGEEEETMCLDSSESPWRKGKEGSGGRSGRNCASAASRLVGVGVVCCIMGVF